MAFRGTIHVDRALSEISVQYSNQADQYVADKIAPLVPVAKESDRYFIYSHGGSFRIPSGAGARAAGSEAYESDFFFSTATYNLVEYASKMLVSDRDRDNADQPLQLDIDASKVLSDQILLAKELQVASLLFATASFTNQLSVATANQWSLDTTASDPLLVANTAQAVVLLASGRRPNKVVMGNLPFLSLKRHQLISDRIKYVERSIVTEELIASLFDVDEVLVGRAVFDDGTEGVGGDSDVQSMTVVWGPSALWLWVPKSPGLRQPSTVYTFTKQDQGMQVKVKKWREEKLAGDYVEASAMFDHRIVASLTGFFASGVAA